MKYNLDDIQNIRLDLPKQGLVFLYGDLGAGKTTMIQNILKNYFQISESITSPTYTYYNKYNENLYHFDLYRLENYDQFFAIGGEEILDSETLCFIEWPDILEKYYKPDIIIRLEKGEESENEREIEIIYTSPPAPGSAPAIARVEGKNTVITSPPAPGSAPAIARVEGKNTVITSLPAPLP